MLMMSHAIVELSSIIRHEFKNLEKLCKNESDKIEDQYESIDKLDILPLLKYSGYMFIKGSCYRSELMQLYKNYGVCFIYGAKRNDEIESYECCEVNGRNMVIIFMDYFKPLIKQTPDKVLGYSIYLDELVNIAKLMLSLIGKWNLDSRFDSTIMATSSYILPFVCAITIVAGFVTLSDNDMSGMRVTDVVDIIKSKIYPISAMVPDVKS